MKAKHTFSSPFFPGQFFRISSRERAAALPHFLVIFALIISSLLTPFPTGPLRREAVVSFFIRTRVKARGPNLRRSFLSAFPEGPPISLYEFVAFLRLNGLNADV